MRILLLEVFVGLLAVINSSPTDNMTQIPVRPEEDVLEEVITDGFIVDHFLGPSFTTEPPKRNATIPQTSPEVFIEGSGLLENHLASKTESPEAFTTIQTSFQPFSDISGEGSGFLVTPTLPIIETPEPTTIPSSPQATADISVEGSGITENLISSSPAFPTTLWPNVGEGSGDFRPILSTTTKTSTASTTLIPSTKKPQDAQKSNGDTRILLAKKPIGVSTQVQPDNAAEPEMHKGHTTPDWIIILGFLVGLAALITLCAAIATRDKWNGPKQTSVNETNASNQKRELEMQTFLPKEEPKENGKDSEYTVIPLDDLGDHQTH